MIVRDALLDDPRPGDVVVTPATGAYGYSMANNYNGQPRPPVVFCATATPASSCAARPTTTCSPVTSSEPPTFRIGLLGHGTVGAAFAELLPTRAEQIEPTTGMRPSSRASSRARAGPSRRSSRAPTSSSRSWAALEPARDYVLRAMRAGRHVVTANKQLLAQHGEELWAAAREHGVQLRFEAAVAGVVPVIRVLQESLAAAHVERVHGIVNGTTNYILSEMAAHRRVVRGRRSPTRSASATPRPTRPTTSPAGTPPRRWRSSRGWRSTRRCHLDQVPYEGIEHITADDLEYARELGLGLKLIGTAERVDGGLSRPRAPRVPLRGPSARRVHGPYNAVTVESPDITEITMSRPGRRRPADGERGARRRHQRDDPARLDAGDDPARWRSSTTSSRPSTCTSRSPTGPACSPRSRRSSGMQGASIKSVVQKGLGENARLVMVVHPLLESRFFAALELIGAPGLRALARRARSG